jgi:uncharacterized membrane protein YqjE
VEVEPDATIGDLVRRLTDDSRRLVRGEVRLAKLEMGENLRAGAYGVMWLALAFGIGVIALTALTIALAAGIGRIAGGHMWVGALVTGVLELALGAWLIRRGIAAYGTPSYTLGESREELRRTKEWLERERAS